MLDLRAAGGGRENDVKDNLVTGVAVVGSLAVFGIVLAIVPSLQTAALTAGAEASEHLERARRLVAQYDAHLGRATSLRETLRGERFVEAGFDIDLDDPDGVIAADEQDVFGGTLTDRWASFQPVDPTAEPPRPIRVNLGNPAGQIREGLRTRDRLAEENAGRLDAALHAVNAALTANRNHPEANRLKAVVLEHKGLGIGRRALAVRHDADPLRTRLTALAAEVATWAPQAGTAARDAVEARLTDIETQASDLDAAIRERKSNLAGLDATIRDLEGRIADARSRANAARDARDALAADGIDLGNPDGGTAYAARYRELDDAYRSALREAHALEHGTLPEARIDPTGDMLTGRYVENGSSDDVTVAYGLAHFRDRHAVATLALADLEGRSGALRDEIARLDRMQRDLRTVADQATAAIASAQRDALDLYETLRATEEEAVSLEDAALSALEQAASAAKSAASYADAWVRDAAARTRDMPPRAEALSAHTPRKHDGWLAGYARADQADAQVARAWVFYERYRGHRATAAVIADVREPLALTDADPDDDAERAATARDAGVAEVLAAMETLKAAHRATDRHWTVAAQAAGTEYLLALFGDEAYAERTVVPDVIARYRDALTGREDKPYTAALAARLQRLEAR